MVSVEGLQQIVSLRSLLCVVLRYRTQAHPEQFQELLHAAEQ